MKNNKVKSTAAERERERERLLKRPTVKELIRELEYKNSKKILEKPNFDFLLKLINKADTEDEIVNICTLGTSYYQTGLKFSPKLGIETGNIHYLNKNKKLSFKQKNGELNKFIIGDNYHALNNLLISHRNKIDVIYIDPPYGCNDLGEGAKVDYKNQHLTREHLLSMLKPRLLLAQQLLSEDGIILCSIDDKNQAYVKCLFDDVFGEINFINQFCWINNLKGRQISTSGAAKTHEFVICYAKNSENVSNFYGNINVLSKQMPSIYKEFNYDIMTDGIGPFIIKNELYNTNSAFNEETRPKLVFNIFYDPKTKDIKLTDVTQDTYKNYIKISPHKNADGVHNFHAWRWGREKILKESKDLYFKKESNNTYKVFTKIRDTNKVLIKDVIQLSGLGTREVESILGKNAFVFPKPINLMKFLLNLSPNKNATILDFYAGSGTTGQAVLELNKEDGGNRKFILCTNNENNIAFDVTYERCKRVMTGESSDNSKFDWQKNAPLGGSLDVIEIKETSSSDPKSIDKIDETVYELEKFTNINKKIEWVCSNFDITTKKLGE